MLNNDNVIKYGDVIFVEGLILVILRNLIIIYNYDVEKILVNNNTFSSIDLEKINYNDFKTENLKYKGK